MKDADDLGAEQGVRTSTARPRLHAKKKEKKKIRERTETEKLLENIRRTTEQNRQH